MLPEEHKSNMSTLYQSCSYIKPYSLRLLGLASVLHAQHDRECAGRQHLLIGVVVQTVRRGQGKSIANLVRREHLYDNSLQVVALNS